MQTPEAQESDPRERPMTKERNPQRVAEELAAVPAANTVLDRQIAGRPSVPMAIARQHSQDESVDDRNAEMSAVVPEAAKEKPSDVIAKRDKQRRNESYGRSLAPTTAVQVDFEDSSIIVRGRCYVVDLQPLRLMKLLIERSGAWVSSTSLAEDPLFAGVRIDRLCKRLPPAVQELIESQRGKGYRLRFERQGELCQKSSVAQTAS